MPFYKDDLKNVHFIEDYNFKFLLPENVIEITAEEAAILQSNKATTPTIEDYEAAVQRFMDSSAKSFGYDDIKSAVTYAEEPSVIRFQLEGKSFRTWRSLCWDYCYEQLDRVQKKERNVPTVEELVAELPQFVLLQG